MAELDGRVAIVTGSGRGLGATVAKAYAANGARVMLTARSEDQLQKVKEEITSAGGEAEHVAGDVSVVDDVLKTVNATVEKWGKVDILVANAGISHMSDIEETSYEFYSKIVDINLKGTMYYTKAVIPHMKANNWGRVIITSSIQGTLGSPHHSGYNPTKWGQIGFMKCVALEMKPTKTITANCVLPPWLDTYMLEKHRQEGFTAQVEAHDPEEMVPFYMYYASEASKGSTEEVANFGTVMQTYRKILAEVPDAPEMKWLAVKKAVRDKLTSELKEVLNKNKGLLQYFLKTGVK
ncbi:MAG: SDR family NAD(P)-dependent oxidoreductase [Promethearchaeota archaeon]